MQITSYEETGNTFHNDDHLRAGQSGDFKLVACWAVSHELSVAKFDKTLVVYSGCLTLSYFIQSRDTAGLGRNIKTNLLLIFGFKSWEAIKQKKNWRFEIKYARLKKTKKNQKNPKKPPQKNPTHLTNLSHRDVCISTTY